MHIQSSRARFTIKGLNLQRINRVEIGDPDTMTQGVMTLGKFERESGSGSAGSYPKLVSVLSPEF